MPQPGVQVLAFQVGHKPIWEVQFHLEVTPRVGRDLLLAKTHKIYEAYRLDYEDLAAKTQPSGYAQVNRILHADTVDVETGGLLMLTLANGIFASIDCSWSKPLNYPTWGGLTMELISERGLTVVDSFSQNLNIYNQSQASNWWTYWGSDANQAMLEEFVAAIREQRAPKITGEDGYKALEVALAAYASAESGQPVKLPLDSVRS